MKAFELSGLYEAHAAAGTLYHEFLRVPDLSMGLYVLPADSADPQHPHNQDEVYYVVGGRAMIQVAGEECPVETGSIVYVAAHDEHRFHSIEKDLHVLVFFAPAESQ